MTAEKCQLETGKIQSEKIKQMGGRGEGTKRAELKASVSGGGGEVTLQL